MQRPARYSKKSAFPAQLIDLDSSNYGGQDMQIGDYLVAFSL
ncbi:MAG: hypothetical protein ACI9WS_001180 [Paraglaciecola psychrophila]|jgi:hypothetical protein